jgi:hypothetical protein
VTTGREGERAEDLINVNNTVIVNALPDGQVIKLRDGSTAEVTANPKDGAWLFIKFLTNPDDPSLVGTDDMVFATDVVGLGD